MKSRIVLAILIICSLGSCSEDAKKPKHLVSENKYITLLAELQLVRSYGETTSVDSVTVDSLTSEIFKRYGISDEEFHASHHYYQRFPAKQKIRIEKAIEQLKMDQVSNTPEDTTSTDQ